MSLVKVSVIIPTYKSWDLLAKCLEAISVQTYSEPFEVLVVNNDSDNTIPQQLKKYDNVTFLHELKPGSYAARNKGISAANGEILVFTDADCIPQNNWLENGVSLLENTPDVGIIAGNVKLFYKNNKELTPAEMYDKYTAFRIKEYVYFGNCVTANWFSYKQTMIDFGCFDENLKSGGDTALSSKIGQKMKIVFGENVIVNHPARFKIDELKIKYRRMFGGRYVKNYQNKNTQFLISVLDYCYRRLKFNIGVLIKGNVSDFFKILYVHLFLLPHIFSESVKIVFTKKTERN